MIVDDDPVVCNSIARLLRTDFEVVVALDGEEALACIEEKESFHVIICDVQMARINGPSFRDSIRRVAPHLADRIVFLTGTEDAKLREQISDHLVLTKPFEAAALKEMVTRVATAARQGYFPRRIATPRTRT